MEQDQLTYPWVVVSIDNRLFGLYAEFAKSMVLVPRVAAIVNAPHYVRGVINLRGTVLNLVDLRVRLGMRSYQQESNDFCEMLTQREKDHKNWLAALESAVREEREITVQTNPHLCAFGKWYDNFETKNAILARLLKQFDAPHKRIHAIALEADAMMKKNQPEDALRFINECREGDLSTMIRLFEGVRQHVKDDTREIAVVVEGEHGDFALAVDSVESVESLEVGSIESMEKVGIQCKEKELISLIGKREKSKEFVLLLDHNKILEQDRCFSL